MKKALIRLLLTFGLAALVFGYFVLRGLFAGG